MVPAQGAATNKAPIQLASKNPHYFAYGGKTVALVSSGEHYGAVINPDVDFRRYLDTIQAAGFNYTRLFGGSYVEVPGKSFGIQRNDLAPASGKLIAPWARSSMPGFAGGGNKFDLTKWNPEYFRRFHEFMDEAEKRGIVVEISLFSAQYNEIQWNVSPFNRANNTNGTDDIDWKKLNTLSNGKILGFQEAYARKLVHEANGFSNVTFEIQNEPWSDRPVLTDVVNPYLFPPARNQYPNSIDLPDAEAIAWEAQVAKWISDEEASLPNHHLIAQNYSNFRLPIRELIPGISIINFHYAYPEAVTLNYGLRKAIAYDETGFLGQDDEGYLRQAWNFMLSGGGVFNGLDYSFTPGHEDGSDTAPNGPGGGSPNLRRELGLLSKFLQGLPLEEMVPGTSFIERAPGVTPHALSSTQGIYAIYLDGDGPTKIALQLPAGSYEAIWTDVHSGMVTKTEELGSVSGQCLLEPPPFRQGIALRVSRNHN
jgi:hypothetical protein